MPVFYGQVKIMVYLCPDVRKANEKSAPDIVSWAGYPALANRHPFHRPRYPDLQGRGSLDGESEIIIRVF